MSEIENCLDGLRTCTRMNRRLRCIDRNEQMHLRVAFMQGDDFLLAVSSSLNISNRCGVLNQRHDRGLLRGFCCDSVQ